jgi:hypothetical protein
MSIEAINATSRRTIVRPTYAELSARRGAGIVRQNNPLRDSIHGGVEVPPAPISEPVRLPAQRTEPGPVETVRIVNEASHPLTYGAEVLRAMEKLTACHGESDGTP